MSSLQLVSQEDIPMKNCIEIKLSSVKKYLSIPNINGAVVEVSDGCNSLSILRLNWAYISKGATCK